MGRGGVGVKSCVAVPATAKRGVGEEDAPGRRLLEHMGRMPVVRTRAGSPCDRIGPAGRVRGIKKKPRPQVAGLTKGVGGIWLWMGGDFGIWDLLLTIYYWGHYPILRQARNDLRQIATHSAALRATQTTAISFVPRGLRMTANGSEILRCAQDDPLNDRGSLYEFGDFAEFGVVGGF